jgi:DNA-binding CsgD family transcriptional regulator
MVGQERRYQELSLALTLAAIAKARQCVNELVEGASLEQIAKREGKGERQIRSLIPLAFASPEKLGGVLDQRQSFMPTDLAKGVPILRAD